LLLLLLICAGRAFQREPVNRRYTRLCTLEPQPWNEHDASIISLLGLPSLRNLEVVDLQRTEDENEAWSAPYPGLLPTSSVHVVTSLNVDVRASAIIQVLKCCNALTEVHCTKYSQREGPLQNSAAWCMELPDALQRQGDSVEALTLNAPSHDLKVDPETEITHFEDFKSMKALRNLSVPS
jgi:hypothetical protein